MPIKSIRSLYQPRPCFDSAGSAGASVLFDNSFFKANFSIPTGTSTVMNSGNSTWVNAGGVGSGSNGTTHRAFLIGIGFGNNPPGTVSGVGVTWNGVSMTQIGTVAANGSDMYFFGIVNPGLGDLTLALSWTGSIGALEVGGISVVGADQTGGTTTFHGLTSNTSSGSPSTVTVPSSPTGEIAVAQFDIVSSFTAPSGAETNIGSANITSVSCFAMDWLAGTGAATLTYGCGAGTWLARAVSIKAG